MGKEYVVTNIEALEWARAKYAHLVIEDAVRDGACDSCADDHLTIYRVPDEGWICDHCLLETAILELIMQHGAVEGAHHKQWMLDQIARFVIGSTYEEWLRILKQNDISWDAGVKP